MSLFLIGLGAKFMLVFKSGSSLPFLDQWDAEAINTYIPYFNHTLSIAKLLEAHNEHRIVVTKIYDLVLLLLNRQWDSELQMALNAIFYCGALACFGWLMALLMGRKNWPFIWLPLVASLVLPFGWENTLSGFQSVFYFMVIFALLTLWLLGMNEPWSGRWKLGVITGIIGLFTLASGFVAAAALVVICLLDLAKEPELWRRHLPTAVVCAGIIVAGLLLKADVPLHHMLQAQSILALEHSLGKNLAWPATIWAWAAPLNLLPLAILAWMYTRSRERRSPAQRMTLATGLWGILQGTAVAYARGGDSGHGTASRYMDMESFIMIANCLSIVLLVRDYRPQLGWKPIWQTVFVLWGACCLWGLWVLTQRADRLAIPALMIRQQNREMNTRAFMATDDPRVFDNRRREDLAHPDAPELVSLLRDKTIRRILPACVREPLPVVRIEDDDRAFVTNGYSSMKNDLLTERSWGSFSGAGAGTRGSFEGVTAVASSLPYLEIPVAGDLGESGLTLELIGLRTGNITSVKPPITPGEKWENVYVRAPREAFKIVARDQSETKWFAFKEPRETGRLSYWARQMLKNGKYFMAAGVLCLLWSLVGFMGRDRQPVTVTERAALAEFQ